MSSPSLSRRNLLYALSALPLAAVPSRKPVILLRSGWQTVNIGDIAHTPGMLQILKEHLPECQVILWPNAVDRGTAPMLERAYPGLRIFEGAASDDPGLRRVLAESDLLLHGSAAGITSEPQFRLWQEASAKPFGYYGVGFTLEGEAVSTKLSPSVRSLIDKASFFYTRETASLANLKRVKAEAPILGFAPDATFSMTLRDDEKAEAFIREHRLEAGKFLVTVPRLRYTPYQLIRKTTWSPEETSRRMDVNDRYKEPDHAKMREAITAWVRKTGHPVVICPEMTYQIDIMDELVFNPLPADVKPKVIQRKTFWLPDEANSFYAIAASVLSYECHSPILAITQGTPCFYVHQPEDGIKGHMWNDLGLGDWYFEIDQTSGQQLAEALLKQFANRTASVKRANQARLYARRLHAETSTILRKTLKLS